MVEGNYLIRTQRPIAIVISLGVKIDHRKLVTSKNLDRCVARQAIFLARKLTVNPNSKFCNRRVFHLQLNDVLPSHRSLLFDLNLHMRLGLVRIWLHPMRP